MEHVVLTADTIPAFVAEFQKHNQPTHTPPPIEDFMTAKEVAAWLKISRQTLYQRAKAGVFKQYGAGTRHIRFRRSEIVAALETMGGKPSTFTKK